MNKNVVSSEMAALWLESVFAKIINTASRYYEMYVSKGIQLIYSKIVYIKFTTIFCFARNWPQQKRLDSIESTKFNGKI